MYQQFSHLLSGILTNFRKYDNIYINEGVIPYTKCARHHRQDRAFALGVS